MNKKSRELTLKERAMNSETWAHIHMIQKLLASAQMELMRRQFTHDQSKLVDTEVRVYAEHIEKLRDSTYGSDEYKKTLEAMGPAITHHYAHNRHHPEFFKESSKGDRHSAGINGINNRIEMLEYLQRHHLIEQPDDVWICPNEIEFLKQKRNELEASINGMTLFDLIEMLCDWVAATHRHADGDINKSLDINEKRFSISPQLQQILRNTVPWISNEFSGLETQKDLKAKGDN